MQRRGTKPMKKEKTLVVLTIMNILASLIIGCDTHTTNGAVLFERERCIYCHRFKGQGATIGPDLTDITKRRSAEWIGDQIRDPGLHYPNPGMPGHKYLSKKEISALIKYLKS